MTSSSANIKQVLRQIINQPAKQTGNESKNEKGNVLRRQVNCLSASNNILSQQLSQEIQKRQCISQLYSKERDKNQILNIQLSKTNQILFEYQKSQRKTPAKERSVSQRKYSARPINSEKKDNLLQKQNKELKNILKKYEGYHKQLELELIEKENKNRQLQEQVLFMEQYSKRAISQKYQLELEHTQALNQLQEMKQFMNRQNQQILRLSIQAERNKREQHDDSILITLPDVQQDSPQNNDDFSKKINELLHEKQADDKFCFQVVETKPHIKKIKYVKNDSVN